MYPASPRQRHMPQNEHQTLEIDNLLWTMQLASLIVIFHLSLEVKPEIQATIITLCNRHNLVMSF